MKMYMTYFPCSFLNTHFRSVLNVLLTAFCSFCALDDGEWCRGVPVFQIIFIFVKVPDLFMQIFITMKMSAFYILFV